MEVKLSRDDLLSFEERVATVFNTGQIKAPVHLHNGNEDQLIDIFLNNVDEEDHLFCSWRSHYHCLLKGVPEERLYTDILDLKSISLCYPQYKIYSSAIVGGNIPIALGYAIGLKLTKQPGKAVCFVGDMTAKTGAFLEAQRYAQLNDLPILFVIEDNGRSVCTDTKKTWTNPKLSGVSHLNGHTMTYKYTSKWPHAGAGQRVQF